MFLRHNREVQSLNLVEEHLLYSMHIRAYIFVHFSGITIRSLCSQLKSIRAGEVIDNEGKK